MARQVHQSLAVLFPNLQKKPMKCYIFLLSASEAKSYLLSIKQSATAAELPKPQSRAPKLDCCRALIKGDGLLGRAILMDQVSNAKKFTINILIVLSIIQSSTMFVCLKLKISVTTEPIWLYSSGNIPTGPFIP